MCALSKGSIIKFHRAIRRLEDRLLPYVGSKLRGHLDTGRDFFAATAAKTSCDLYIALKSADPTLHQHLNHNSDGESYYYSLLVRN